MNTLVVSITDKNVGKETPLHTSDVYTNWNNIPASKPSFKNWIPVDPIASLLEMYL